MVTRKDIEAEAAFIQKLIDDSKLVQCDVRQATHVKLADGTIEKIAEKWGVGAVLGKPSQGGFGVITDSGKRVTMWDAHSYFREPQ